MTETGGAMPPETVRVWDPLVRLFHWSLVGLFAFAFLTGDEWKQAHEIAGYAVGGLIAFRVLWGFVGTRHARFSDFIYSPRTILTFIRESMLLRAPRYLGHNPAGGMMVVALLLMIAATAITGHMMTTDQWWGIEWVEEVHEIAAFSALGLVILHLAGVALASLEHRENLIKAMFTGRKRKA